MNIQEAAKASKSEHLDVNGNIDKQYLLSLYLTIIIGIED